MQTNLFETEPSSFNFKITDDPHYIYEKYGITEDITDLLNSIYPEIYDGSKATIKHLERLCIKYPGIPNFKNFLAITFKAAGYKMKAEKILKWTIKTHPEFLFARINRAIIYLENGQVKKVPHILGKSLNLGELYPDRNEFHEKEVLSYHQVSISYFLAIDDFESAENRMQMMEDIDPDAPITCDARDEIMMYNLKTNTSSFEAGEAKKVTVTDRGYRKDTQTDQKPKFTHPEIEQLYQFGFDIPEKVILEILELPNESLVRDLEMVIDDTINRYEYFKDEVDQNDWDDSKYTFSLHAIFLLAQIGSEKSLDKIFELLRQGEEFLDFWYSLDIEIFLRFPIAKLGINKTEALTEFLKEPNNSVVARNIPLSALDIIGSIDPDYRNKVSESFEHLFQFHLERLDDENIIDSMFLSYLAWSSIDIGEEKLLAYIKPLYEQDLILEMIVGSLKDVSKSIKEIEPYYENFHYSIMEHYDHIMDIFNLNNHGPFSGDNDIFDDELFESLFFSPDLISNLNFDDEEGWIDSAYGKSVLTEKNPYKDVGRNAPCPCGSGRKYKKCCQN